MKRTAHVLHTKPVARQRKERKVSVWKELVQFFVIVPILFVIVVHSLFVPQVEAASGINKQINFQGKLVDNNGLNVADSSYSVVFSLYTVSSGGAATWTETDSVSTANGVFQVALGAGTPFPGNVDFNSDTWYLGIKVGSDAEMTPRVRFSAVPYAFNAAALDGIVATNSATQFTLTGGTNALIDLTVNGSLTLGSTIKPTAAGALTVQSNGANGLTLDTGGAAALAIGATANTITFGATNNPSYSFNGTGAFTVAGGGSNNITFGSSTGTGTVIIQPNAGGQAALIIKDQGSGDLLTASAGAATKFVISNTGNIKAVAGAVIQPLTDSTTGLQIGTSNNTALVNFDTTNSFVKLGTGTSIYSGGSCKGTGVNEACAQLHVVTSTGNRSVILENTGGANVLTLAHSTGGIPYEWNFSIGSNTAGDFDLYDTNGNTAFDVAPFTNWMGIGKNLTSPKAPLHVEGASLGNAAFIVNQISSNTNDILTASASGATKFTVANNGSTTITSNGSSALAIGANGVTNPVLQVDASTGSVATGLKVLGAATGGTTALTVTDSGSNANLSIDAKGSGTITIGGISTGNISLGTSTTTKTIQIGATATAADTIILGNSSNTALKFGKFGTQNGLLYISATDGTVGETAVNSGAVQCLTQTSSGAPTWGNCSSGSVTLQNAYNAGQSIDLSQAGAGLTLGTNTGNQNVVIAPNAGGNAALIINKQADLGFVNPNIFVASSAGVLKFAVDSGGNATAAGSLSVGQPSSAFTNAIGNFSGNVNNFLQVQVQNKSNGNAASTDFIATADNGTDTTNYIDLGINGSGYNQAAYNIGGANDGYLYSSNGALTIGTASNKPLIFHTNGTTSSNEAMRIDALGKVAIGTVGTNGGGNGQLVVNQTNNSGLGDIIAASAAGATKFVVHNDGSIQTIGGNATADITSITAGNGLIILPKANGGGAGGGLTLKGGNGSTTAGGLVLDSGTGTSGSITMGSANATSLTFGGSQNPTFAFNGTGAMTIQGTTINLGNGSTSTIQTSSNGGITLLASGTGTITLGQNAGVGGVVVQPNAGGQAALTINDQGLGDLLTASSSGTTQFLITRSGTAVLGASVTSANALASSSLTIYDNGLGNSVLDINQLGLGDIFTASAAGATKFKVANNGSTTITSNSSSGLTVGANGATNPVFTVNASTASVATGLQVLGAATGGTTALTVTDSGSNANLSLDAKGSGTITIGGTSTGNIILGTTTNGLTFNSTSGPSYTGTARPTKQMVISAEYPGAVLTASASAAITGNMTSDASPSAITNVAGSVPSTFSYENYYQWSATALGADQRYTVAVRVTLPKDFSAWLPGTTPNALTIDFNTPFTNSALDSLDVYIYQYGDTSSKPIAFRTAQVSSTSKNWKQVTIPSTDLTGGTVTWDSTHPSAMIFLTMHSTNTVNYVQVGDITLNYLAGF